MIDDFPLNGHPPSNHYTYCLSISDVITDGRVARMSNNSEHMTCVITFWKLEMPTHSACKHRHRFTMGITIINIKLCTEMT